MNLKTILRKIHKRIFHRILGKFFYQGAGYYNKKSLRGRITCAINQYVNEKGWQTPFIYTPEECLEFWKSLDNNSASVGNRPELYAKKSKDVIEFLQNFWSSEIGKDLSILEIGCNCGANLFWLQSMGYKNLSGIEINPNAIKQMDESFPGLKRSTNILIGDTEEILKKMRDGEVDVIFTVALCMNTHPAKNHIFKEMKRVAKKYICTIEEEVANSNYVFARNYRRVFEKYGCRQLKSVLVGKASADGIYGYDDCIIRLFKV